MSTKRFRTLDLTLAGMFAALMAIGANITSWAPFLQVGGVPLSLQPFFVILAGLLIGIAGAPVFAQFKAGIGILFGSTGGFLLSYIVAAFITGKIMEMRGKPTFSIFLISSIVGIAVIYLIGTTYMYVAVNYWLEAPAMTYAAAWKIMSWFAVKDLIFTVLGAMLAPRIYKALRSSSYLSNTQSNKVS